MYQSKQVVIFGSNGMLGRYICSYLQQQRDIIVQGFDRSTIDASKVSFKELIKLLKPYRNAYVINCVGKIPQRGADDRSYIRINTVFPHLLAAACNTLDHKMIHITTDCVYTGSKGSYNEEDPHDETNLYGLSKSMGEPQDCCIIRTSIIGEELENKKSLLEWIKSNAGGEVNGYTDHYWNGVTCLQLAKIIYQMVMRSQYWVSVRHIHSPDTVSKSQIVQLVSEVFHLNIKVKPISGHRIDKSLTSIYDSWFDIPSIADQIKELRLFSPKLGKTLYDLQLDENN